MGSYVELNDALQITTEQGFPEDVLDLKKHRKQPTKIDQVKDKIFEFRNKPKARVYHTPPCRCYLVHNIGGKWLHWGHILIIEQTISWDGKSHKTSGKFKIIKIYDPKYQEEITKKESPEGKSFF